MARIVVLSRRSILNPLSGGAGRYVHEIFRRLATRHSITVLSGGTNACNAVEQVEGITYRQFSGTLHRILLPLRYVTKFAGKTDLLIDNSDVGIPWLSPLYSRVPCITIIHQLVREIFYDEFPRPLSNLSYAVEPLLYRLYSRSKIVAASQSTAGDLVSCGIPIENIDVVEPGCSYSSLPPPRLDDRSSKTIGCVSRLMKYKGLQFVINALSEVTKKFPDAKLLIAGSGPYQRELYNLAESLGISANVQFLGRISEMSKFKLYGQSRVAVYPSHREGFGISVIEANSMGTPVVGWRVPGSRDAIIDGETGFLAPYPDETKLAQHLSLLLSDDETWRTLSNNAWEWAKKHSWQRSAYEFEKVIEEIV